MQYQKDINSLRNNCFAYLRLSILGQTPSWFTRVNLNRENYILHSPHTRQKEATEGKAKGDVIALFNYVMGGCKGDGARFFWWCTITGRRPIDASPKTRNSNSHNEGGQIKRFLREDLGHPSLEILQIRLDNGLSNLL